MFCNESRPEIRVFRDKEPRAFIENKVVFQRKFFRWIRRRKALIYLHVERVASSMLKDVGCEGRASVICR